MDVNGARYVASSSPIHVGMCRMIAARSSAEKVFSVAALGDHRLLNVCIQIYMGELTLPIAFCYIVQQAMSVGERICQRNLCVKPQDRQVSPF